MRAGASRDAAKRIIKKIRGQIYRGVETHDIYKMVLLALGEEQDGAVLKQKYQLKEAIMRLGPTGFFFEDFVGEILKCLGFKIKKIRGKINGECIVHEVDLIANTIHGMVLVECKHHSKHGVYTGLKESLYTHARFLDTKPYFKDEYLICNTKVSDHAKKYARCINQKILSWKYPPDNSLEKIIEKNHLYPITILNITSKEITIFANQRILLTKHILDYTEHKLSRKTGIHVKRIRNLQKLAGKIVGFH